MAKSQQNNKAACCSMERQRLVEELRKCDYCTTTFEEHNRCYTQAARRSGERARSCVVEG